MLDFAPLLAIATDIVGYLFDRWMHPDEDVKKQLAAATVEAATRLTKLAETEPTSIGTKSFEIKARGMFNATIAPLVDDIDHLPIALEGAKTLAVLSARALFERRLS